MSSVQIKIDPERMKLAASHVRRSFEALNRSIAIGIASPLRDIVRDLGALAHEAARAELGMTRPRRYPLMPGWSFDTITDLHGNQVVEVSSPFGRSELDLAAAADLERRASRGW